MRLVKQCPLIALHIAGHITNRSADSNPATSSDGTLALYLPLYDRGHVFTTKTHHNGSSNSVLAFELLQPE